MIARHLVDAILPALHDSPVVLINGARQTGKTTLVQQLAGGAYPARYLTLDDAGVLAAARLDPAGFISNLDGPVILDEIQRAPELFVAIKAVVDRHRRAGRFLLTGSTNVLLLPRLSESLAGRMEIFNLWPFSQGEIEGVREHFIDAIFDVLPWRAAGAEPLRDLVARALRGGYPEVVLARSAAERRQAWFGSYITTILQRDVRDVANVSGLTELPRLLSLLAARAGALQNFAELSRSSTIPQTTLKRYIALLETTFLVYTLPPWSANLSKRLVKSPKFYLADTGLLAHLTGITEERLATDTYRLGPLLENFVVMELVKQVAWSRRRPHLFHFRTQTGQEVDILLEDSVGHVVGLEVKASATVTAEDFEGLQVMAEQTGRRFKRGMVLYTGAETVPFGKQLHAMPVSALWRSSRSDTARS